MVSSRSHRTLLSMVSRAAACLVALLDIVLGQNKGRANVYDAYLFRVKP